MSFAVAHLREREDEAVRLADRLKRLPKNKRDDGNPPVVKGVWSLSNSRGKKVRKKNECQPHHKNAKDTQY